MTETVVDSRPEIEGHLAGTLEDLKRLAELETTSESMSLEELRDFLTEHSVTQSLAWAVRLNPSEDSPREHPEQGITFGGVPGGPTTRYFSAHVSGWAIDKYVEGPCVDLHGRRQNDAGMGITRPKGLGLFDYEYKLRLPIRDYLPGKNDEAIASKGEADDFRLNREGRIRISYATRDAAFEFDSDDSTEVSTAPILSLLGETSLELIETIKAAKGRSHRIEVLARGVTAKILGTEQRR